jgi:hypothetical protein
VKRRKLMAIATALTLSIALQTTETKAGCLNYLSDQKFWVENDLHTSLAVGAGYTVTSGVLYAAGASLAALPLVFAPIGFGYAVHVLWKRSKVNGNYLALEDALVNDDSEFSRQYLRLIRRVRKQYDRRLGKNASDELSLIEINAKIAELDDEMTRLCPFKKSGLRRIYSQRRIAKIIGNALVDD